MNKIESKIIEKVNNVATGLIRLIRKIRDPRLIQYVEDIDENQKLMLFSDITIDLVKLQNTIVKRKNKLIKQLKNEDGSISWYKRQKNINKLTVMTENGIDVCSNITIAQWLTKYVINSNGHYTSRKYELKNKEVDVKIQPFIFATRFGFAEDKKYDETIILG